MAIFGAPVAHEDDPERAVRAAVGMQAAMAQLNQRLLSDHGIEFALRVGVNTGEVLAGKVGEDYTVIGDAVNVAVAAADAAPAPGRSQWASERSGRPAAWSSTSRSSRSS